MKHSSPCFTCIEHKNCDKCANFKPFEWPARDLDKEVLDAFEHENPALARAFYSRTTPFPEPKIITISTPSKRDR